MSARVDSEVALPDSAFGAGSGGVGEQARIALNFGPALSLPWHAAFFYSILPCPRG